jgi:membrane-bound lytic murein transglycosylase D
VPLRPAALALLPALLGACAAGLRPAPGPAPAPVLRADVPATPADLPEPPAASAPAARVHRPHLGGVTFDLDVHAFEDEPRVQHYVRLFTGGARATFTGWLARGSRYDAMIRERLRAAGLPEDLRFLPLVESGYEPNAVSRSSAVGMWQFMAPTARELGLRVDWWVDERRDPVRATDAAVRMLRWLRGEFGSHFVAAAAYNGGPTRVQRGLAQLAANADTSAGEARFFALAQADQLRPETKNYVPQLIAATLVAKELPRYGLAVREQPAFAYDTVLVGPLLPLAAVARAAETSREALLDLNPQLLRGLTPPGARTRLRLPVGAADDFAARLERVDASTRRAFRRATTRKRDQLTAVAERERVPPTLLAAYNPGLDTVRTGKWKGRLVSGQAVRVPTAAVLEYARAATADADDGHGAGALPALPAPAERSREPKAKEPNAKPATGKTAKAKSAKKSKKKSEKKSEKTKAAKKPTTSKKQQPTKSKGTK